MKCGVSVHVEGTLLAQRQDDRAASLVQYHLAGNATVLERFHAHFRHQVRLGLVYAQNITQGVDVIVLHRLREGWRAVHQRWHYQID